MSEDTKGGDSEGLVAVAKADRYSGFPFAKIRRSNLLVLFCAVVAALGGFLFGFDTAVISGVELPLQKLWRLNDFVHGLAVAIALYGTVIGAILAGLAGDILGRKMTLFLVGLLYFVSAVGTALAPEIWSFMVLRFIGGLGVGAASVVAPMYITEIAPAKMRGRLVALFQFNVVLGIVSAYVSNYFLADMGENAWRWMLGVEAIPALIYLLMVHFVPESPRWLMYKRGMTEKSRSILTQIDPDHVDELINGIEQSIRKEQLAVKEKFFSRQNRRPIKLAFLIAFFNQMVGINAIIYYAPRIFDMAGLGSSSSLFSTAGIGLINLIFTTIGITMIDKFGRKPLMLIGSFGLIITLGLVSHAFFTENYGGVPIFLFIYIGFFALSQGTVIWVFISEVFRNRARGKGQALGSFTHWLMAALVANVFPFFSNTFGGGPVFLFFMFMGVLQLIWVWKMMPETKGKSLEQLENELVTTDRHLK